MSRHRDVSPAEKNTRGDRENPSPRENEVNRAVNPPSARYFLARFSMGSKSRMATPV
jgi:hypothetical protein